LLPDPSQSHCSHDKTDQHNKATSFHASLDEFMSPDKSILHLAAQITLKGANRGQNHR